DVNEAAHVGQIGLRVFASGQRGQRTPSRDGRFAEGAFGFGGDQRKDSVEFDLTEREMWGHFGSIQNKKDSRSRESLGTATMILESVSSAPLFSEFPQYFLACGNRFSFPFGARFFVMLALF